MLVGFSAKRSKGLRLGVEVWRDDLVFLDVLLQQRCRSGGRDFLKPDILGPAPVPDLSPAIRGPHILHPPDLAVGRDRCDVHPRTRRSGGSIVLACPRSRHRQDDGTFPPERRAGSGFSETRLKTLVPPLSGYVFATASQLRPPNASVTRRAMIALALA